MRFAFAATASVAAAAGCSVSLDEQISKSHDCVLGKTFGCYANNSMWVDGGCEGTFTCGSRKGVTCESHLDKGPVFGVCSCDAPAAGTPNVVFLIVESTDGRTYRPGSPVPIPNIRRLAETGTQFDTTYANAPVCCPSRATIWSGRHAHHIPHQQAANPGLEVHGAWNNYEGLPPDYSDKISDVMQRAGFNVRISGKEDWSAGGHSLNVRLNSWTMYTRFPYNVNETGGWYDEEMCPDEGTVEDSEKVQRHGDWVNVDSTTAWIKEQVKEQQKVAASGGTPTPFFAYQGMTIVHPPYVTNKYWFSKINQSQVTVPEWAPLEDLHPCDLQASMLKKCTPSDADAAAFYDHDRRRHIRSIYYAMIAEFDGMVGAYMNTINESGVWNETAWVVVSDHGDMNMEHQQFYKMVQYDASSRVPLVVAAPWLSARFEKAPVQLIDLFPTILDLGRVSKQQWPSQLEGQSLVPLLKDSWDPSAHVDFVTSQFHGCNIAMSWFLATDGHFKYVTFGTGKEVQPQLFDLLADPSENVNLIDKMPDVAAKLEAKLRSVIDYPSVAGDVAEYNQLSFRAWMNRTKNWRSSVDSGRWQGPFDVNKTASLAAIDSWLAEEPQVKACRHGLSWMN
eukprot:TRINITY_DN14003_c0_g1_i1.p2 TRINITY_DN14003_c0_g1~~TRINITY_DN14003_c0_g1_i1.p2  ORF type:complete len:637 (+),score=193.67 TRINITY_DN14003_c0_g1_i1:54-1913(+)